MAEIVLATLNAKYTHSAFGLRYLLANMDELVPRTVLHEYTAQQLTVDILDQILAEQPRIVGLGVYIWNVEATTRLVADLKRLHPEICVVLGGPEVSYETETQRIVALADYVVCGEADLAFPRLCRQVLEDTPPSEKVVCAELPALDQVRMPYDLYDQRDIAERVVYLEASRGCPYQCEFCLSSLDIPVRQFPLDLFLAQLRTLVDRGVRHFKFVDRTFNLNLRTSRAILEFFLENLRPEMLLHFEVIPDRLPDTLREILVEFPRGVLQFEVGIQTFNSDVAERIGRRQDNRKTVENLEFLRTQTGVHLHTDLIVGLPGEDLDSFGAGFDRLVALEPQEIQIGILKRLKGTPIVRHDVEWAMIYSENPPYELLRNRMLDEPTMGRMRRFARYWNLVSNSGNFVETAPLLWGTDSPFDGFLDFSDWLYQRSGRSHGLSLLRLAEHVFDYLCERTEDSDADVAEKLWRDYCRGGRTDRPGFLRPFSLLPIPRRSQVDRKSKRQARHASGS